MPQASLITITVLASLALGVGCSDRRIEDKAPTRPPAERSLQLTTPPTPTEPPRPIQKARPIRAPEPAMSVPPKKQSVDPSTPEAPAAPSPAPVEIRNGCRPLVA